MSSILIVVGIILLTGMIVGIYKGAVRIAVSLLASLVTLVIVTLAAPYVADIITKYTPIDEMIEDRVSEAMMDAVAERIASMGQEGGMSEETVRSALEAAGVSEDDLSGYGVTVEDIVQGNISADMLSQMGLSEEMLEGQSGEGSESEDGSEDNSTAASIANMDIPRDMQQEAIDGADLPQVFKNLLTTNNNDVIYEELGVDTFAGYVGSFLAKTVIHILSFLFSFVLVTIILRAIVFALNIVTDLPMLGIVNHLFGGVIGIFCALIIVWVIFVAITVLYTAEIGQGVYETIQNDSILKLIYDYNPVMRLATRF